MRPSLQPRQLQPVFQHAPRFGFQLNEEQIDADLAKAQGKESPTSEKKEGVSFGTILFWGAIATLGTAVGLRFTGGKTGDFLKKKFPDVATYLNKNLYRPVKRALLRGINRVKRHFKGEANKAYEQTIGQVKPAVDKFCDRCTSTIDDVSSRIQGAFTTSKAS